MEKKLYNIRPRILAVTSDSHGNFDAFEQILSDNPSIGGFLFLGDGMREFEDFQGLHPEIPMVGVPGNCDLGYREPLTRFYQDHNLRMMLTHGHIYHVKSSAEYLINTAMDEDADAVLYGHTHQAVAYQEGNLWVINPGSLEYSGTYALLKLSPEGIEAKIMDL